MGIHKDTSLFSR